MMHDLVLHEEGSEVLPMDDYYESQPGDNISAGPNPNKRKRYMAYGVVLIGILLVFGGIIAVLVGEEEEAKASSGNDLRDKEWEPPKQSKPTAAPTDPPAPKETPAPVEAPVVTPTEAPVEEGTAAPTQNDVFLFLSSIIGEDPLLDTESIAYGAYSWLLGNAQLKSYDDDKIKQRFAVACLYLATNLEQTWEGDDGWMSDDDECAWYGLDCKDGFLIIMNLTSNGMEGLVPNEIGLLSDTLLSMEISANDLVNTGKELEWMGQLTNLRMLDVEQTLFAADGLPTYLGKLTDMRILDVSNTLFMGELDGAIFSPMKELIYLEIGGNMYNSTLPQEIAKLPKLEALYAYECGLEGEIEFVTSMTAMFELWIDDNPGIIGPIPVGIGDLPILASLSFSNCDLTGSIPTEVGQLTDMEQMWLFGNWLTGSIPTEIGLMNSLKILGVEDNNITDVVMPQEICDLNLLALSADCKGDSNFMTCDCCTCCEPPCPIINLPIYAGRFLTAMQDELARK